MRYADVITRTVRLLQSSDCTVAPAARQRQRRSLASHRTPLSKLDRPAERTRCNGPGWTGRCTWSPALLIYDGIARAYQPLNVKALNRTVAIKLMRRENNKRDRSSSLHRTCADALTRALWAYPVAVASRSRLCVVSTTAKQACMSTTPTAVP